MKKLIPAFIVIMITSFASCKKDKKAVEPVDSPKTVISKDSTDDGTNTNNRQVRLFTYNSSKKLVKVSYKSGTSTTYDNYDTIYYTNGKMSQIMSYNVGNSTAYAMNYLSYNSSDQLEAAHESGTNSHGGFDRNRIFTYTNGVLSSVSVTYYSGSSDGSPENISSIVFTSGNISSAVLVDLSNTAATLTTDLTAPNPYYDLYFKTDNPLNIFNDNNVLKVYPTISPSSPILDYSYTYANGRVATITDNTKSPVLVTYITYKTI